MAISFLHWIVAIMMSSSFCFGEDQPVSDAQGKLFGDILRLNSLSRITLALQFTFPISAFAPNFELFGSTGRSHLSRKDLWLHTIKPKSNSLRCPSQRWELEDYLSMFNINDEVCQERFICDLASDPVKYQPISQFLLPKLAYSSHQLQRDTILENVDVYNTSDYYLLAAARIGIDPIRHCDVEYSLCPYSADNMVNMWMIWGWRILSHFIELKYVAETNYI